MGNRDKSWHNKAFIPLQERLGLGGETFVYMYWHLHWQLARMTWKISTFQLKSNTVHP